MPLFNSIVFTLWCRRAADWKHTASRASLCRWWPAAESPCARCTQQTCWESEDVQNGKERKWLSTWWMIQMCYLRTCWVKVFPHPQQSLLVLAVLHFGRRQVDDGSLHAVPLAAVEVDVRPAHHHVALHPAAGVGLQEVKVALLWHNRAATRESKQANTTHKPLLLGRTVERCWEQSGTTKLKPPAQPVSVIKRQVSRTWRESPVYQGRRWILWGLSSCPRGWTGPGRVWRLLTRVRCVCAWEVSLLYFTSIFHK